MGADVSREGVQRDLLPLVEGSTVSTKYGTVKTDHVLFIASGAFSLSKPSDLIPELQGRLPIRVELDSLKVEDFVRILTEPDASLTTQYKALMQTEGVAVKFDESGVKRIAEIAHQVNERTENIGARRLHTVMERLLETVSYDASEKSGSALDHRREVRGRSPRQPREERGSESLHSLREPDEKPSIAGRLGGLHASGRGEEALSRPAIEGFFVRSTRLLQMHPPASSPASCGALHANASANSGMFTTTPLMR